MYSYIYNRNDLEHTLSVIKGETQLAPFYVELKKYIEDEFQWVVYDFCITKVGGGLFCKKQLMIEMIVDHSLSYQNPKNKIILDKISLFMIELNRKYRFVDNKKLYPNIGFHDFKYDYIQYVIDKSWKEIESQIKLKYSSFNVESLYNSGYGGVTIFYDTDENLDKNEKNKINVEIDREIFEILKRNDDFKWVLYEFEFTRFSSRETFERDYDSNYYYFYK